MRKAEKFTCGVDKSEFNFVWIHERYVVMCDSNVFTICLYPIGLYKMPGNAISKQNTDMHIS